LTLARNDTCYRGAPYLDTYVLRILPDTNTFVNALKTGEVDCGRFFSWGALDDITSSGVIADVFPGANGTRYFYQLDPAKPAGKIFADVNVRRALAYAVDYSGIANAVYFKKGAVQALSVIAPISWAYNPSVKPKYGFDSKQAAAMLDSAGWKVNSSGMREKDGSPLKVTISTTTESPEWNGTAQVIQQNWKQIGVAAAVDAIPFNQLVARQTSTREFDVQMDGARYGFPDPDPSLLFSSANTRPGGLNGGSYKNPALDQLLSAAAATLDQAKRKDIYFQIQDLLNQDAPSIPLHTWNNLWVRSKRVRNLGLGSGIGPANAGGPRPNANQVWVADGK
jgi:peptide/nickel transport system substrate-binding protein